MSGRFAVQNKPAAHYEVRNVNRDYRHKHNGFLEKTNRGRLILPRMSLGRDGASQERTEEMSEIRAFLAALRKAFHHGYSVLFVDFTPEEEEAHFQQCMADIRRKLPPLTDLTKLTIEELAQRMELWLHVLAAEASLSEPDSGFEITHKVRPDSSVKAWGKKKEAK
jgi:hypothetical protein